VSRPVGPEPPPPPRGRLVARGAAENPANRFERLHTVADPELEPPPEDDLGEPPPVPTLYLRDPTRTLLAHNDSPDLGFDTSLNPYRGCSNGCAYCYARPTHEYLGFSAGLDFETRILVKEDAPELLRRALAQPRWQPRVVALSGVTDAYQPIERKLQLTRACLAVLAECRNPVSIITKNHLVTRDIDLLQELARYHAVFVNLSITSLSTEIQGRMEPRTSIPARRLDAVRKLAEAGIPVGVMVGPVVPGLTDVELPAILRAARDAGARWAGYIVLRLPHGVAPLFEAWIEQHFPERAGKVLNRLRDLRGGRLYDSNYTQRMSGTGEFAEQIGGLFTVTCRQLGLNREPRTRLSAAHFRRPAEAAQGSLFD